jgi:hypothetical protein
MKTGLAVVGLLAAWALTAPSASAYLVKGNVDCPDVLKEDANATYRLQNNWWVLGYVSALNYANDTSRGQGVDSDAIYGMLLEYCAGHPADDIDDASQHIYNTLR